jgi:hypothetical protein
LVSTAKLAGNFYNNRQSAANRCLRFACSFVSFMLRNAIGAAIHTLPVCEVQRTKNNPRKLLIGAENSLLFAYWCREAPHFALKRREQCNANNGSI